MLMQMFKQSYQSGRSEKSAPAQDFPFAFDRSAAIVFH
jgi:hypothetical protein